MNEPIDKGALRRGCAALLTACAITLGTAAPALVSQAQASEALQLAMDDARLALEVVFSVALTDRERAWYHKALLRVHRDDPEAFDYTIKWLLDAKAHIESQGRKLPYVNDEYREQHATTYHCGLEQSDEPDPNELLRILDGHNPVIFSDCERSLIIREQDLDAWFASANFVAQQAGLAALSSEEITDITADTRKLPKSWGAGPIRFTSNWSAMRHWWSHMPEDVRERNAAAIVQGVTDREAITAEVDKLIRKSRHENRNLALCTTARRLAVGQARMLHETYHSVSDVLVNPGPDSAFDIGSQAMGIAEPALKNLCDNIWE